MVEEVWLTPLSRMSSLSKNDVSMLEQHGIKTVEALIYRGDELEEIFESAGKIKDIRIEALTLKKRWMVPASEWAKVEAQQLVFKTGSEAFDQILGGGIHSMYVAEFFGEFGVGKCIHPDTPILTPYGVRKMKEIDVGDYVIGVSDSKIVMTPVIGKYVSFKEATVCIRTRKRFLVCSRDHKILTPSGWKKAENLRVGDKIVTLGGNYPYDKDNNRRNQRNKTNAPTFPKEMERKRDSILESELLAYDCTPNSNKTWQNDKGSPRQSGNPRVKEGSKSSTRYPLEKTPALARFSYVFGGLNRRRRDANICFGHPNDEDREGTARDLATPYNHKLFRSFIEDAERLFLHPTYFEGQKIRAGSLHSTYLWLETSSIARNAGTTFNSEERTCENSNTMDKIQMFQTGLCSILRGRTEAVLETEKAELNYETIQEIRRMDATVPLQDITTLSGNYIAAGVVVHNSQILNTIMVLALNGFPDRTAIYIDCEGTYRDDRVRQIAKLRGFDSENITKRIILIRPATTDDLLEVVKRLYLTVESRKSVLIVCDSLISHLRAEFIGREMLAERQQMLLRILGRLKQLASLYNIGVVVSNQVVAVPTQTFTLFGDIRATGGHVMAHNTEPRVYVRKGGVSKRVARIEDSVFLPPAEATFRIAGKGIEDISEQEEEASKSGQAQR